MIETALPEVYMPLVNSENIAKTFADMLHDPDLKHVIYEASNGAKLIIVNAAKSLHTPVKPHHMLAKGIVFAVKDGKIEVVCMPFTKFYNGFEHAAQKDIPIVALKHKPRIARKMDGTLIARWVYNGEVFYSTRGRILNAEKNEFWDMVQKVIKTKDYYYLPRDWVCVGSTMLFELVGPSNVILEFHPEDDLVLIGYTMNNEFPMDVNDEVMYSIFKTRLNLNVVEVYDGEDPDEVIKAFDGVREGVVVNYTDGSGVVRYRVKYKQEEYLKLVRAKNHASPERLYELALENAFKTFQDVEAYMDTNYAESGYLEELKDFYKVEWPEIETRLSEVRQKAHEVFQHRQVVGGIENRKERFFKAKELVGDHAGFMMQIVDGKMTFADLVMKFGKKG